MKINEIWDIIVPIMSMYLVSLAFFAYFLAKRREKKKKLDVQSEPYRWIENSMILHSLGMPDAAIIIAFVSLEQVMRGIAKSRGIVDSNIPFSLLCQNLFDKGVIPQHIISDLKNISDIRNQIIHGQGAKVDKETIETNYEKCLEISEELLKKRGREPVK